MSFRTYHGVELFGRVNLLGTRKYSAGLPGSRGTVEQQVRELVLGDEGSDCGDDVLMGDQLLQGIGPVFLHPRKIRSLILRHFR